jgi:transcriptional regulator with XRE-family HTH domain
MIDKIWRRMKSAKYRHAFVAAHVSNTIAAQIATMRQREGWTQKELAEKTGMKQSRISALEDPNLGNVEISTLRRIAAAFDVALTVRFVPFSAIATHAATMSTSMLNISKFDDDYESAAVTVPRIDSDIGGPELFATVGGSSSKERQLTMRYHA